MFKKAAPPPPPQDEGDEASIDSSQASLEDDLQALKNMDIDADFNQWSSFKGSFSVQKRESLRVIGNNKRAMLGAKNNEDSLHAIEETGEVKEDPLLKLSPAEQEDINKWQYRLKREQVFSRYYFPEQWELREMSTIQEFLNLQDPNASYFTVSTSHICINVCELSYLPANYC